MRTIRKGGFYHVNHEWHHTAVPTIAREIKLSEATVRSAIRDLRKAGLVEIEQRYRTKGGKSSLLFRLKDR